MNCQYCGQKTIKMIKKKELGYSSVVETSQCVRLSTLQHPQKPKDKGEEGMLNGIGSKALWVG